MPSADSEERIRLQNIPSPVNHNYNVAPTEQRNFATISDIPGSVNKGLGLYDFSNLQDKPATPAGPSKYELEQRARIEADRKKAADDEAKAKKAGKDKTSRENQATRDVIDGLLKSMGNYESGRDKQLGNAKTSFETALQGVLEQYLAGVRDTDEYAARNEADYDMKSNANTTNMVREKNDLLSQALSQGAGETDMLRALTQAARNFDQNRQGTSAAYNDTLRSINSQLSGLGVTATNARTNAFNQNQEAQGSIWNDYYKNMTDSWTNIQRTEAGNSNIESDYSTGFEDRYGSNDSQKAIDEIAKYTGKTYETQKPGEGWANGWEGKKDAYNRNAQLGQQAAAVAPGKLQKAEGATLRKWA